MAATITLPDGLDRGLRDIATLSDDEFATFLKALESIPAEIRQHSIFPRIRMSARPDGGEALTQAAFAMVLGRAQRRASIADAVKGISASAIHMLTPPQFEIFEKRVADILSIDNLDIVARSHHVLLEHSATYSSALIVSDIRAVFGDDVTDQPDAAVIVHMLNFIYYSAGRRESIALALDEKDIDLLMDVLERARTKNKTLKETITKSGLKYIKVT